MPGYNIPQPAKRTISANDFALVDGQGRRIYRPRVDWNEERFLTDAGRKQLKELQERWDKEYQKASDDIQKENERMDAEHRKREERVRALADADRQAYLKLMDALRYMEAQGILPPGSSDLEAKITEIQNERIPDDE